MDMTGRHAQAPPPYACGQVSEHASWSAKYYGRVIAAALAACHAPPDLVQIVTGYGEAGNALVTGGVDKLIFVGSTAIGKKVHPAPPLFLPFACSLSLIPLETPPGCT